MCGRTGVESGGWPNVVLIMQAVHFTGEVSKNNRLEDEAF